MNVIHCNSAVDEHMGHRQCGKDTSAISKASLSETGGKIRTNITWDKNLDLSQAVGNNEQHEGKFRFVRIGTSESCPTILLLYSKGATGKWTGTHLHSPLSLMSGCSWICPPNMPQRTLLPSLCKRLLTSVSSISASATSVHGGARFSLGE